jgi:hypothetical protein
MYIICLIVGLLGGAAAGNWMMGAVIGLCIAGGIHLVMFLIATLFIKLIIDFFESVSGRR